MPFFIMILLNPMEKVPLWLTLISIRVKEQNDALTKGCSGDFWSQTQYALYYRFTEPASIPCSFFILEEDQHYYGVMAHSDYIDLSSAGRTVQSKTRSSCFTWVATLNQWLVFRIVCVFHKEIVVVRSWMRYPLSYRFSWPLNALPTKLQVLLASEIL